VEDAAEPGVRCRYQSERQAWLQILAEEIGADVVDLEATTAAVPQ